MYIPHKQNIINKEFELIKSIAYKTFVDKYEVMTLLNCSEKTVERRLKKLGYTHTLNNIIQMLKDFESDITTKQLAIKYNCSEVNINATARRHNILRNVGFSNKIKSDFQFFDNIDTEEKAYILRVFCC